jgi:hypothetical protein
VSALAAVLGLDEAKLFESAGLDPPLPEIVRSQTVEQTLSSIAPGTDRYAFDVPLPSVPTPKPPMEAIRAPSKVDEPAGSEADARHADQTEEEDGSGEQSSTEEQPLLSRSTTEATQVGAATAVRGAHRRETGIPRGPRLIERLRLATLRRPRAIAPLTTLPPQAPARSYVEDADERLSYKLRALYTVVGVGLAFIALVWAASNFFGALKSVWDLFFSNL